MEYNRFNFFHRALEDGDIDSVAYILDLYEGGIHMAIDGETPLNIAVDNNRYELVEYLLEEGANVNQGHGVEEGEDNEEEQDEENKDPRPIHKACYPHVSTQIMRLLLSYQPGLEYRGWVDGYHPLTPLLLAIVENQPWKVKMLLESGADKEATTQDVDHPGETALELARNLGFADIVELLL